MKRVRPNVADFKIEAFGKTTPARPLNPSAGEAHSYSPLPGLLPGAAPSVDRTYKMYIGGAQVYIF